MAIMRGNGAQMLHKGDYTDIDARVKQIDALTRNEVNDAMRSILTSAYASSYVGKQEGYNLLVK